MNSLEIEAQINVLYGKISENKNYLKETDYIVIRDTETGVAIPAEVRQARAAARDRINAYEAEIAELEAEKQVALEEEARPAEENSEEPSESPAETQE